MIAETLCLVSNPNFLDDCKYAALSGSERYHSAVRFNPSSSGMRGAHPIRSRTLLISENQSVRSHSRLGMLNTGSCRISKSFCETETISPIVVLRPVPMLKD